jgi:heme-degrading monooxygenase HmoA
VGKEGEFERFVRETGIPTVEAQAGCSHAAWGRSRWSDHPEFVVVTHWDSLSALEAFAGRRWQDAVIEPEEEHMLAQVFCDHYETVETG